MGAVRDVPETGLAVGADGLARCFWRESSPDYHAYHDREWGTPLGGDDALFERICLEGFQSGLSWITILRKREAFRKAFAGFEIGRVASFTAADVERLMNDDGIVRNRAKIEATVNNARRALDLVRAEGGLGAWLWRFEPPAGARRRPIDLAHWREVTRTPVSTVISAQLKQRGWSFVGPTTCYAVMQAIGMVNDHMYGCACREDAERRRKGFVRPSFR